VTALPLRMHIPGSNLNHSSNAGPSSTTRAGRLS
jgi:hypothetical protein